MSARKVRSGMKKKIIACLERQGGGPLSIKKLNSLLGGGKEGRKEVQSALGALVKEGKVKFVTPKKVILAQPSVRVTGKFFLTPAGNGFVAVRGMGSDVFIPKSQTMGAFHNDVVEVEISGLRRGRTSGRVVRIVERGIRNVVGRLSSRRGRRYLSVEDKKLSHVFEVLPGGVRASEGDLVMAKIEEGRGRRLSVRLVENLGREDSVNSLTLSTLCVYGFDRDFPDDALAQAEKLPRKVLRDRKRVDLTGLPFVTIDGENARDFDDAICVFREGRGFRLLVSIADVSAYVPWDSPLDLEARRRGTS
ncbi:MAG: RNB domain-containing ribonuclease, partial [Deltaproteobacteria bacterium]